MRWYIRLAVAITAAAVLFGTVLTISSLTATPFEPSAVCTGKKSYAVAQHSSSNTWQITILGRNGEREKRYKIHTGSLISYDAKLSYDGDSYYFWDIKDADYTNKKFKKNKDVNGKILKVYQITGENRKALNERTLQLNSSVQIYGMHVHENTMSVVTAQTSDKSQTELTVYTVNTSEQDFKELYSVTLPMMYIRDAVFCSDGMLYFISSAGRVYLCSEDKQTYCLDEGIGYFRICTDQNDTPYFLNEDGNIKCLTDSDKLKPAMRKFMALHPECKSNLEKYKDFDILSEDSVSAICETHEKQWRALLFHKKSEINIEHISEYKWWQKALMFIGIFILYTTVAFLLWIAVLKCFSDDASLKYRMAFVCLTSVCLSLVGITIGLSKLYVQQENEQSWEQMAIFMHFADVYLEPESHKELMLSEHTDSDALLQMSENSSFIAELRNFISSNHEQGKQYLLIVPDKNEKLYTIAGTDDTVGHSLIQICGEKNSQKLKRLYQKKMGTAIGYENRCGTRWMYIAKRFGNDDDNVRGILLMRTAASEINKIPKLMLLTIAVLYLMSLLFITLLYCRLCRTIRPLSDIEQQAHNVMLKRSFDAAPVNGRNEIALLSRRFNNAVNELIEGMDKSRLSAESCERFMNHDWLELIGKENLYQIHAGEKTICQAAVLEMRIIPRIVCGMEYRQMYEKLLAVVRSNNGIPECLEPERMRFLFPQGSMNAICAASAIHETTAQDYEIAAVIDYGTVEIIVLGDEQQSRFHSFLHGETDTFSVMRRVCSEYGCAVLVTYSAVETIEHFHEIFNSRFIGFFQLSDESAAPIRLVEILEQKNSSTFEDALGKYYSGEYILAFSEFCQVLEHDPKDHAAAHYLELCNRALHGEGK